MTTSTTSQQSLDILNAKIQNTLSDRVILKPLTRWNEAYKEFPRYVMEYLVSRYVKPDDPVAGQEKIDRILTEHYAESAKKETMRTIEAAQAKSQAGIGRSCLVTSACAKGRKKLTGRPGARRSRYGRRRRGPGTGRPAAP